jgi:hypothetical protein
MQTKTPETVKALRNNGLSFREISNKLGVGETTVRDWYYNRHQPRTDRSNVVGYVNENLSRISTKNNEDVLNFLENLSPINCTVKSDKVLNKTLNDYCVVIGDMHFPVQDKATIDIFFEVVRELNPKTIILNGDTLDMFAISKYPKDIRHRYSLMDERVEYHKFLAELISISNGCQILETNANHSGNDISGRWFRYLSDRLGELASLPDIKDRLSYGNVFLGEYQEYVDLVDYVELTPEFIVLHGDIVRKNGGYSAKAHMDKWMVSIMHNHTHRIGSTAQRFPGIGSRKEKQIFAWENGCACDLSPVYGSAPNWQNGFSIISLDKNNFGVEQIKVLNKSANISTLGVTIKV